MIYSSLSFFITNDDTRKTETLKLIIYNDAADPPIAVKQRMDCFETKMKLLAILSAK